MNISIDQLAGGGAAERINRELAKIAENVLDPNTKADAVRALTITLKIKPNESREMGAASFDVKSTLAPAKGLQPNFLFAWGPDGRAQLAELKTNSKDQLQFDNNGAITDGTGEPVNKKVVNMTPYK
jgi:hypothetical protein